MVENRVARLAVNNEGFAFDPHTGESFMVNVTGAEILNGIIANQSEEEITASLAEHFEVTQQEAQADVRDFFQHLRTLRLVQD